MYKTTNNISNDIMNELFEQPNILYNLQSQEDFTTGPFNTVNNGPKSLRYLGPKKFWTLHSAESRVYLGILFICVTVNLD